MNAVQETLPRKVGKPRDKLGRFFTDLKLARAVVRMHVKDRAMQMLPAPKVIVEPSGGDGAFVTACREQWPHARITAVDVDRHAAALWMADKGIHGDWLEVAKDIGPVDLVIGNPPFNRWTGRLNSSGKRIMEACGHFHVQAALEVASHTVVILPWDPACAVKRELCIYESPACPAYINRIRGRPWGANVRGTHVATWIGDGTNTRETRLRVPSLVWQEAA